MNKILIGIISVIVIIFVGFLVVQTLQAPSSETESFNAPDQTTLHDDTPNVVTSTPDRDPIPAFTLNDLSGASVSLNDFAGRPLVVNTWASWCPFCVTELPDFVALQEEFGEQVVVIAINRQESIEQQQAFLTKHGLSTDDLIYLADPDDDFYKSIGGITMPETLFVDSEGNIAFHKRGFLTLAEAAEHTLTAISL